MNLDLNTLLTISSIVAPISVTIILYLLQSKKNRKSIIYEIIHEEEILVTPLNEISKSIDEIKKNEIVDVNSLVVKVNGEEVSNLWVIRIVFLNNGTRHIDKDDFEEPISIHFKDNVKIISSSARMVEPSNIALEISSDKQSINLAPLLLNKSDSIAVKMILINHQAGSIDINCRIRGIPKIKRGTIAGRRYSWLLNLYTGILIVCLLIIGIYLVFNFNELQHIDSPNGESNKTTPIIMTTILGLQLIWAIIFITIQHNIGKTKKRIDKLLQS